MITNEILNQFSGTENYYNDFLGLKLTDGTAYLSQVCCCGWLVSDISAVYSFEPKIKENRKENNFLICCLNINKSEKTAVLTIKEDTDSPILYTQKYTYTDISKYYSGDEIKLYLIDGVLLLPSEY